ASRVVESGHPDRVLHLNAEPQEFRIMTIRVLAVLTAGAFVLAASAATAQTSTAQSKTKTSVPQAKGPSASTQTFLKNSDEGGQAEIDLATIADSNASNSQVKDLARMIKSDHEAANAELNTLAGQKNVHLPSAPNAAHKAMAGRLEKLKGAEFDKAY